MIKHPGEILREEYLIPMSLQPSVISQVLGIDFEVFNNFVEERQPVTPELARKISAYYEDESFWLYAQINYDKELLSNAKKQMVHLFRNVIRSDKECEKLNQLIEKINNVIGE